MCFERFEDSAKAAVHSGCGQTKGRSPVCVPGRGARGVSTVLREGKRFKIKKERTLVNRQSRCESESLATTWMIASVGAFLSMNTHVLQRRMKVSSREGTRERGNRVETHLSESERFGERFPTDFTAERSISSMHL